MSTTLDWTVEISDIGGAERHFARDANATELKALAEELEIVELSALRARYSVRSLSMGRYRLKGTLAADVVQACVVSLEPVPSHIEEDFEVEYRPPDLIDEESPSADRAVLDIVDIEPLPSGAIDAGRIVFEHLSAAIDPYPRKPGAEFQSKFERDEESGAASRESPFAILGKLKPRTKTDEG